MYQCSDPAVHPAHDFCPGLDGTEVPAVTAAPALVIPIQTIHNPFTVACPDCLAPAGARCRITTSNVDRDDGLAVHGSRRDSARLRAAVHGACQVCGRWMIQLTHPAETRHPALDRDGSPIPPCPPLPVTHGVPVPYTPTGAEAFTPDPVQPEQAAPQPFPPPPVVYDPLPPPPLAGSNPMQDPPGSTV